MVEDRGFLGRTPARREGVSSVTREPAREVATVVRVASAVQRDLVAVVDERRAARGEEERVRELAAGDGGPGLVHEAPGVVQSGQGDENGCIRIETIVGEHHGQLPQRLPLREGAP